MLDMKQFLYLLPLALCPVMAEVADAKSVCMAALDSVQKAQSEDMTPVITAVLDATGGDEQAYLRLMREASDAGHPVALLWSARQILNQIRTQNLNPETSPESQNMRAAVEQAASKGYAPAMVELAHICGNGIGAPADEKAAMNHLMQACRLNSARARAGYLLLSGRLEKDALSSAAVNAELKKNNFYVEEFMAALQGSQDEAQSREWLTKAAEHGSAGAACTLAFYYFNQKQDSLGYEYLQKAVSLNHPEAMAQLASWYLPDAMIPEGIKSNITPDVGKAIRYFQVAALLGYTPALIPLAGEYHKQPEKYSPSRVFELYRMAADAGDPRGGVAYGYCLVCGRGCTAEPERGVQMLTRLVDAGVPFANMALADLYFNGTGVPADMGKAIRSLSAAASAGVPQSYTLMAVIAQLGNASKPSEPNRARMYLRMAKERGEVAPQETFDNMVKQGSWKFIP